MVHGVVHHLGDISPQTNLLKIGHLWPCCSVRPFARVNCIFSSDLVFCLLSPNFNRGVGFSDVLNTYPEYQLTYA